jgi:hypothetical protein
VRVLATSVGYGLPDLVQQDGRGAVVLTEGSNWPAKQRRVADGEVRAAETGWHSRRGLMLVSSGLLIPAGMFSAELGSQGSDQHSRRNAGGEDLRRRTDSPAAASGSNSGEARVGGSIVGLEKLPGGEAELLRGLPGAGVQQGGRSTVEQGAWGGGARRVEA